jgi:hypothetical protein
MKDLGYSEMKDLWRNHPELVKYSFPLDAYFNRYMRIEYALANDHATTECVLKAMSEYGYRCSIVEQLLEGKAVTQPQQWVSLTDEDIESVNFVCLSNENWDTTEIFQPSVKDFARAIEAKLKEKNNVS